jgi:hypothetical protein
MLAERRSLFAAQFGWLNSLVDQQALFDKRAQPRATLYVRFPPTDHMADKTPLH